MKALRFLVIFGMLLSCLAELAFIDRATGKTANSNEEGFYLWGLALMLIGLICMFVKWVNTKPKK